MPSNEHDIAFGKTEDLLDFHNEDLLSDDDYTAKRTDLLRCLRCQTLACPLCHHVLRLRSLCRWDVRCHGCDDSC